MGARCCFAHPGRTRGSACTEPAWPANAASCRRRPARPPRPRPLLPASRRRLSDGARSPKGGHRRRRCRRQRQRRGGSTRAMSPNLQLQPPPLLLLRRRPQRTGARTGRPPHLPTRLPRRSPPLRWHGCRSLRPLRRTGGRAPTDPTRNRPICNVWKLWRRFERFACQRLMASSAPLNRSINCCCKLC